MVDLRRAMDEMTNEDYDRILSIIGNPIVKNLIYKTNVEVIKYIPFLTRIIKKPS
jgi:tetrahydromethanopterin S-methyltransferase subunit H